MNIDISSHLSTINRDQSNGHSSTSNEQGYEDFHQLLHDRRLRLTDQPESLDKTAAAPEIDPVVVGIADDSASSPERTTEEKADDQDRLTLLSALLGLVEIKPPPVQSTGLLHQNSGVPALQRHSFDSADVTRATAKRLRIDEWLSERAVTGINRITPLAQHNAMFNGVMLKPVILPPHASLDAPDSALAMPVITATPMNSPAHLVPSLPALPATGGVPLQWQSSLAEQIVFFNRNEIKKAEISLHPKELGSLHIQLEMQDGKMDLNVAVMHSVVKGILESALPYLRTSLAEQGIDLQNVHLNDDGLTSGHFAHSFLSDQSNHRPASSPTRLRDESESARPDDETEPAVSRVPLGVSVFA